MKKNYLFALAMAAAFASCSDDNDSVVNPGVEASGDGYIALAISMPSQNSTRAFSESTDLDDGSENEYEVHDAAVVVFNGTESTSTVTQIIPLTPEFDTESNSNQITSTSKKMITKVSGATANTSGLLVVLNENGLLSKIKVGDAYSAVSGLIVTSSETNMHSKGFFMTNAPLATAEAPASTATSWSGDVKTLATITQIYPSEAAALAATAPDQVFVERSVAKVTMTSPSSTTANNVKNEYAKLSWTITGWALNNTNTASYLLRNTTTTDMQTWAPLYSKVTGAETSNRWIGSTEVKTDCGYRTYFAKDPNYDGEETTTYDLNNDENLTLQALTDNTAQYCFENTFDVANMKQNQTTHVVLEATLVSTEENATATDFYIVNNNKNSVVWNLSESEAAKKYVFAEMEKLTQPTGEEGNETTTQLLALNLNANTTITWDDFTYTFTTDGAATAHVAFTVALKEASKTKYSDNGAAVGTALTDANDDLVKAVNIAKYAGGKSYYVARIKHFGDDFTPWSAEDKTEAYPGEDADANWLGRYGVLRNNWYELSVSAINNIGEPTVGEVVGKEGTDTDDEVEQYVVMQINILSWAKRSQNVEL